MSIADWFTARETNRYTKLTEQPGSGSTDMPDGVWVKCDGCKRIIYEGELLETMRVCKTCGFHFDVTAPERVEMLADEGSFVEMDADLMPCDPLEFVSTKPYTDQLASAAEKSGRNEALISGRALIDGRPVVLAVMDFRFIGASMGSVVGEKVTRAFELATAERLPIVIVTASGGARMQEGMISLMQMAKTSAAARKHSDAGLAYLLGADQPHVRWRDGVVRGPRRHRARRARRDDRVCGTASSSSRRFARSCRRASRRPSRSCSTA